MTKEAVMTHSTKTLRASAVLAALFIAACASPISKPENGTPIEQRFPIAVEPHMETLRVPYNAARGNIDEASGAELQGFARDYLENGSGTISVSATRRIPDAPNYVVGRLVAMGVPRERIMMGSDDALSAADEVKVTYVSYQAHASSCGDWSVSLSDVSENKASPNFGCATQHNLAAMVADPRDLVTPKPIEPGDAQRRLTVLEKYRKGDTTVAIKAPEQTGAVSTAAGGGK
jgi:pilus assembly protein CpaD